MADRFELVVERGQIWDRMSVWGRLLEPRTVRAVDVDAQLVHFEESDPSGAALHLFLGPDWRLRKAA